MGIGGIFGGNPGILNDGNFTPGMKIGGIGGMKLHRVIAGRIGAVRANPARGFGMARLQIGGTGSDGRFGGVGTAGGDGRFGGVGTEGTDGRLDGRPGMVLV